MTNVEFYKKVEYLKDASDMLAKIYHLFGNAGVTNISQKQIESALKMIFEENLGLYTNEIETVPLVKDVLIQLGLMK